MSLFKKVTPYAKAEAQLYQARMDLLDAQACKEHYDATCEQLEKAIARLVKYLEPKFDLGITMGGIVWADVDKEKEE